MKKSYSVNLKGRVKNFPLPKIRPLIPLFEAVVNSIDAISERRKSEETFSDGRIVITVVRSQQLTLSSKDLSPVESFIIEDNGIGFTERNLESFMESDSEYKAQIGGKGVGRFSWLKAFAKVYVSSVFKENNEFLKREFEFSLDNPFIDDTLAELNKNEVSDYSTNITLYKYLAEYQEQAPKQLDTIALKLMQHCLVYFLDENCPEIIIKDDNETININKLFRERIKAEENTAVFKINNEEFKLLHVKIEDKAFLGNRLYICANNRLVESKDLTKYIVDLGDQIFERCGFWYLGILTGNYLDDNVDMNRLSFNIPENESPLVNDIAMESIIKQACAIVKEYLKEYLERIKEQKIARITDYAIQVAPQYRHLLKHMRDDIERIKPDLPDDKLDDELYKIKRKFDKIVNSENAKLFERIKQGIISTEEYETEFKKQIEKISDANSAALAEYVAHRRTIINLLEYGLYMKEDGTFSKENYIHNLIYPMKTTSDDIKYESHNLWLIDEKLAYCTYIASDIPLNRNDDRTDILILDHPIAVSEEKNDGSEFDTIIIFELKRPMRDDYTDANNPVLQLSNYLLKIKNGQAQDKNGRPIKAGTTTKFYLYAVCDITDSLDRILMLQAFSPTPDKMGYYRYNERLNAYIEILSYDKILNDAKKRNQVLFDKLGI